MTGTSRLPHLRIHIDKSGVPSFTLDGDDYTPPGSHHPAGRDSIRRILDSVRTDLGAIRIEIVEADGSIYSDVLTLDDAENSSNLTTDEPGTHASGFLPGEPVAVAVIINEHTASDDGTAHVRLPAAVLARHGGVVMLLGRSSGTLTFLGADR